MIFTIPIRRIIYFSVFALISIFLLLIIYHKTKNSKGSLLSLRDNEYEVIVVNKSKSPIYFRGSPSLISCGVYNNEKIYYVTLNLDRDPDFFGRGHSLYFDIDTKIDKKETKSFFNDTAKINNRNPLYAEKERLDKMLEKIGDANNILYERKKEIDMLVDQHPEFCSDVHYLFYFTRKPYMVDTYTKYIEIMKNDGYAVLGHLERKTLYFTVTDAEIPVSDNAINDLLLFVHTLQTHRNVKNRVTEVYMANDKVLGTKFWR
jgi:hypothetical protein